MRAEVLWRGVAFWGKKKAGETCKFAVTISKSVGFCGCIYCVGQRGSKIFLHPKQRLQSVSCWGACPYLLAMPNSHGLPWPLALASLLFVKGLLARTSGSRVGTGLMGRWGCLPFISATRSWDGGQPSAHALGLSLDWWPESTAQAAGDRAGRGVQGRAHAFRSRTGLPSSFLRKEAVFGEAPAPYRAGGGGVGACVCMCTLN